jgi:hypothetical protein
MPSAPPSCRRLSRVKHLRSIADYRYPFSVKPEGGYSMPEFDADWEKGIFPMGQVPVLQANGHRFAQARPSASVQQHVSYMPQLIFVAVEGDRALHCS